VIRRISVFFLTVLAMLSVANIVCQAAQPQSLLTRHVRDAVIVHGSATRIAVPAF